MAMASVRGRLYSSFILPHSSFPMTPGFSFRIEQIDSGCGARRSVLQTPHGAVELPAFMPVGTQATV